MSRHRNLQVGYRPAPRRGFLPRAWHRSACASSFSLELRYAVAMREPDLLRVSVSGRLARLAGRGPPEVSGWWSIHATRMPPEKPGESPNSDGHSVARFISSWRSDGAL